jgi:cytochrome P450
VQNIQAQTTNTVVAGSDTVSTGVQSFLYHLLRAPDALTRVRAEIAAALAAGRCRTRVVAYLDAQQLPYLQACVKEALRVHSPIAIGLPRVAPAPAGLEIGGRHFPPGTVLSVNPWVVHLSPEIWGPDAREFNPDRWLRDDAARLDKYILTVRAVPLLTPPIPPWSG